MSKLQELINKLCPNGVEYKTIGELASYRRGSFPQPYTESSFYGGEGAMPFVQVADIENKGFKLKDKTKQTISKIAQSKSVFVPKGTVLCSIQGTIGRVAITQYDSYVDRTIAIFESLNSEIDKKFFAYCIEVKFEFEKEFARGSTLKTITKEEFTKFKIPVPPIEVQDEIVRILDNFTNLQAELQAELERRIKQYRFYRNKLLKFENYRKISIKNISNNVYSGKNKERVINGKYNVYGSTGIISTTNTAVYNKVQILIARVGANSGYVHIAKGEYDVSDNTLIIDVKDNINFKYVFYQLANMNLHQYAKGGGQSLITAGQIKGIELPIPPIDIQNNVVNILDNFDDLCNNVISGLPAEIEKRQKQYEYYRNKLLSFKEL